MTYPTIIVGGGVAGLTACYALGREGERTLVLEKYRVGRQTTWAAAGMLAPIHELEFQELALLRAGQAALAYYDVLETELGPIGLNRAGTLEVALTADDVPYLERQYQFQLAQGLAVTWLTGKALLAQEPMLAPSLPAGIHSLQDIQVDNRQFIQRLTEACQIQGADLREGEEVTGWEKSGELIEVHTPKGDYTCQKLLLATGSEPQLQALPFTLYPVKGQMLSLTPPPGGLIQKTVRIRSRAYGNAYLVPKADRIVVGSTAEEQGRDTHLTAGGVLDILRKAYLAVPGIYELPIQETWVGLRPAALSRLPILQKEPGAEVYYLNGLYRHGILLGPLLGKNAAQLMRGEPLDEVVAQLLP